MNFRQCIQTKFIGPTNTKGSRIKAFNDFGSDQRSITISYDHSINSDQNHVEAARALLAKYGLDWELSGHAGCVKGGYVFTIE